MKPSNSEQEFKLPSEGNLCLTGSIQKRLGFCFSHKLNYSVVPSKDNVVCSKVRTCAVGCLNLKLKLSSLTCETC